MFLTAALSSELRNPSPEARTRARSPVRKAGAETVFGHPGIPAPQIRAAQTQRGSRPGSYVRLGAALIYPPEKRATFYSPVALW